MLKEYVFFILRGPGVLQSDYYTGSSLELEYGLLAPLSLFETRVFVDGHDAWVLGKECVDYLERGPRRRRSAVEGVPRFQRGTSFVKLAPSNN